VAGAHFEHADRKSQDECDPGASHSGR
jgi:hypothetical protein